MSKVHNNAVGIIIKNRAVLMVRAEGKEFFISPGGAIEAGETAAQAVCRELLEECSITVKLTDLSPFGVFRADAVGRPGEKIVMTAFLVNTYEGTLRPSSEVEELEWINSINCKVVPIGSIFQHEVIPRLKKQGLID